MKLVRSILAGSSSLVRRVNSPKGQLSQIWKGLVRVRVRVRVSLGLGLGLGLRLDLGLG